MQTIFIAIDAKHCHMNPAVRILTTLSKDAGFDAHFCEFTVNDNMLDILSKLYTQKCDLYIFSCYIWNIELVLDIAGELKKLLPGSKIALGGPEVTYRPADILNAPAIDYVLSGEGEDIIVPFIEALENGKEPENPSVATREHPEAIPAVCENLNGPFPYTKDEIKSGRLVYYETSRGCPFSCHFCLSSVQNGVRYVNEDRVVADVTYMARCGARVIKFLDRTFNADKARALRLFKAFAEIDTGTVFHFEICAQLLNNEIIEFLKTVPRGRFQFEIGVQSTFPKTLMAINRSPDLQRLSYNIGQLYESRNIHLHLDLIAGLPYETFEQFKQSFNDVYPYSDKLQLGFLKLLYGTALRNEYARFGYRFLDKPPYEVLENGFMTFDEILKLKNVETELERFRNSDRFRVSLSYIIGFFRTPYDMFEALAEYTASLNIEGDLSLRGLYHILYDFGRERLKITEEAFTDLIRMDYSAHFRGGLDSELAYHEDKAFRNNCTRFLRDESNRLRVFHYRPDKTYQEISRDVEIHSFISFNNRARVLIFDYKYDKITDITATFND
ncbi:MAG: DUF4080 domain-containing protein [Bacillota bacterium]|nr:DUF4080 domain-containing protein [Bacillota bacterium]